MKTAYVLIIVLGEYEDRQEVVAAAFTNEAEAQAELAKLCLVRDGLAAFFENKMGPLRGGLKIEAGRGAEPVDAGAPSNREILEAHKAKLNAAFQEVMDEQRRVYAEAGYVHILPQLEGFGFGAEWRLAACPLKEKT